MAESSLVVGSAGAPSASSQPQNLSSHISLSSSVIPLTVDSTGRYQYESIALVGHSPSRIVYTRYSDSQARPIPEDELYPRPSPEAVAQTTENTRVALEAIVESKIKSALPKTVAGGDGALVSSLVQFRAAEDFYSNPDAPRQRVIRMVEQKVDPLDPSKFKFKKIPRGPPSPPVPILHSPPRKATADEQKAWAIPPSISNWKNPKGYTIPLDKRLACDGRGLQETVVSEKFAAFAESLYVAESHARDEVSKRNDLERQLADQERLEKEAHLRELAQRAREERSSSALLPPQLLHASLAEREEIRRERMREREREFRLSRVSTAFASSSRRDREAQRDISERIALGVSQPSISTTSSVSFDQRLFNLSEGMSSGFAASEDSYDLYDRPLFAGSAANAIYRPSSSKLNEEDGEEENAPSRGRASRFEGLGASQPGQARASEPRSGPVQFERGETMVVQGGDNQQQQKERGPSASSDPFGLDSFLQAAKKGRS